MRAAVLHQYNVLVGIEEVQIEEPRAGEVLVRIAASGICGSDVHLSHGKPDLGDCLPIVLGHEGSGVVEAVGPGVIHFKRGDRVIISMGAPCGQCDYCGEGRGHFCVGNPRRATFGEMADGGYRLSQNGKVVHSFVGIGSLGEYAVVNQRKVHKIIGDSSFESMCLVSCGVTTGLGAVFHGSDIKPGSTVLVFGCGGVGLSIIQGAVIAGASNVIAVDNNPRKLDLASDFGASHCITSPDDPKELPALVRQIVARGVDVAFDAVGADPARLQHLMAATDMGGLTVAVGVLNFSDIVPVMGGDVLYGARRLTGVRGGNGVPAQDIPLIQNLYNAGRLKLDELIGAHFEIDDIGAAFDAAAKADCGRVVVRMAPDLL